MIGSELAHYRILAKLGSGGMGDVYLAEDSKLERKVALKVLPSNLTADPARLKRLSKEAKALAALNHPNIVTVYSVEEAALGLPDAADSAPHEGEPQHFITMELVEGRTLAEAIPEGGMAVSQLCKIAVPLAGALAAAHEKGIVHRDLKPRNVMLTTEGRLKVLDFGLAKQTEERGPVSAEASTRLTESLTDRATVVGTAPYMAPEQVRGEPVDARSDIFAFGIMLYQMATGRRPFSGDTAADIASSILRDDPTPPTALGTQLPDGLERLIRRCLEKDPRERLQSALDARLELEDLARETASSSWGFDSSAPRHRQPSRLAWTVAALLAAAAVVWWLSPEAAPPPPDSIASPIRSMAVLPFANLTEDAEQAYFVQGVQEALIKDLSKIDTLRITSRTSTLRFKNPTESAPEIAKELGVDALVEGSVLRIGDQVRITAQVIRGETDEHLWSGSYDREIDNVLVMLSEVAARIVGEIEVAVTPQSRARLARARPVVPEAHEALLRGRHAFERFDREAAGRALAFFEEAARLDPTFAEAHASVGLARQMLGFLGNEPWTDVVLGVESAVERALELDPENSTAHTTQGFVDLLQRWDFRAAETHFSRAIELNPSDPFAYHGLGDLLALRGDLEGSLEKVRIAGQLDPLAEISVVPLAGHLVIAGYHEEALQELDEMLEMFPDSRAARSWKMSALWAMGRHEDAIELCRELFERAPPVLRALEAGYVLGGPKGALRAVAEEFERRFDGRRPPPMTIAGYFGRAGDADRAFRWLERAIEDRDANAVRFSYEPGYVSLRSDPRYEELLDRIGVTAWVQATQ